MKLAWISRARREFHSSILESVLTRSQSGIASNADKGSKISSDIANAILDQLGDAKIADKLPGQTSGAGFEEVCLSFVKICFEKLLHLRPGHFTVAKGVDISQFEQYAHLDDLEKIAKNNRDMATALGSDYLIKPDIIITRAPEDDEFINRPAAIVDMSSARLSSIRKINQNYSILHASISCKWTLRSDRAQNTRSEALNLVRNRKGRLPHIVAITGEPMPGRIASLALGTGDIDCVYHFALYELQKALTDLGREDALELLETMIEGKRLRDISDLPLDLVS